MRKIIGISILALTLQGCITFSWQKDKTGDYAWQSIGWQGPSGNVTPLIKFDGDKPKE